MIHELVSTITQTVRAVVIVLGCSTRHRERPILGTTTVWGARCADCTAHAD